MLKSIKKILHLLSFGVLFVPLGLSKDKTIEPSKKDEGDSVKEENYPKPSSTPSLTIDFNHVFVDSENKEFSKFLVNRTRNQHEVGIHPDGKQNSLLRPDQTNQIIKDEFLGKTTLRGLLKLFHPAFDEIQINQYLESFPILVGQDIDYYLESVRKGSYGTTVMSVDRDGKVHFDSLSLKKTLISSPSNFGEENLRKLIAEEFFQAHQYDSVVAALYNSGYLNEVAGISSPEALNKEMSTGNLRAFMELFPQQKMLNEFNLGRNSYNYYVGDRLVDGPSGSTTTIGASYSLLNDFINTHLGIITTTKDFINPDQVKLINNTFRLKYLPYYHSLGVGNEQVQIWNLVGMKRTNVTNPENSLDMRSRINLPTNNALTKADQKRM